MGDAANQAAVKFHEGLTMLQKFYDVAIEYLVQYGFQVLGGLIILFVGWKLADWTAGLFTRFAQKRKFDVTLTKFVAGIIRVLVLIFAALMAIEKFGVTISPLIATVSALIFGASFAIQAPLSNYAAGLMVILTRPFAVGNTISIKGVSGVVHEIKLPCTVLVTEDGEKITIPNKEIVGEILYNSAEYKVVESSVGISYGDDPKAAIDVVTRILKDNPKVTQSPVAQVGIASFGDSAIMISMRYWVPTKEYYHVLYAVNLSIYEAFKKSGITIPSPQHDVRIISQK